MEKLKKAAYLILYTLAVILTVFSILSAFSNTDNRYLKMLDFPRIQFFIASIACLILLLAFTHKKTWFQYLLIAGMAGGIIIHGSFLIWYTPLVSEAVPAAEAETYLPEDQITLLLANVKMSNRTAMPLLNLVETKKPDLFLAMEVDDWWNKQLIPIEKDYPYTQENINEVAYGMTLYSKYPLKNVEVNYLQNEKVPSFTCTIQLNNGKEFMLYAVHPVPPKHFKDFPDNAGAQEVAMMKIGEKVAESKLPAIVAGDINDVSWGFTDRLTQTENLLHDVRVGRGFYNSYNAESLIMRWPLDHIFVTGEFKLTALEKLPYIDSDHFPIYASLVLK